MFKIEQRALQSAIQRCHNPYSSDWERYGALNVEVSDILRFGADGLTGVEWLVYHIGRRPPGMSLDRIDPWGNYELGNLRWATTKQQTQNRRKPQDTAHFRVVLAEARRIDPESAKQQTEPRRQWLTEAEVEAIIKACENERDRLMVLMAYRHGLRVSELIGLA
jgi:integrase